MEWKNHPDFPFVKVPKRLAKAIGAQEPGRRCYERFGEQPDFVEWYNALVVEFGPMVSGSHLGAYVGVSSQAIVRATDEGRITQFAFKLGKKTWKSRWSLGYGLIPKTEADAWARIVREG